MARGRRRQAPPAGAPGLPAPSACSLPVPVAARAPSPSATATRQPPPSPSGDTAGNRYDGDPGRAQGPPCRGAFPRAPSAAPQFPSRGRLGAGGGSVGTRPRGARGGLRDDKSPRSRRRGRGKSREGRGGGEGRGVLSAEGRGELSSRRVTPAKLESANSGPVSPSRTARLEPHSIPGRWASVGLPFHRRGN